MGGSSGGGDSETTVRYAGYVEDHHKTFLDIVAARRDLALDDSPFDSYTDISYADSFFGSGYTIASFPSLYDMFGKFMAGLDVDTLFTQILDDSINNAAINNRVIAHADELSDDIIENALPRFNAGVRDLNAIMSSSYVTGRAMIETARTKAIARYDASLRHAMLPIAAQRWSHHLQWNQGVISTYSEIMKLYFTAAMDLDNHNMEVSTKNKLWPFTVLEYNRAALGALQGAMNTNTDVGGASKTQKAIGGALAGAAGGFMIGGLPGAVAGGVLGAASAFL